MDQQSPFTSESTIRRDPVVELVVQGGRYHGKRYRLPHNFTLIGNDATCELKLESREISSIQCALIQTPQGLLLRALRSDQKVSVNNQVVTDCILREDDKLRIGPVVFKVQGLLDSELMPLPDAIPQSKEREALRAQAAAVVAQQVELEEQQEALLLREKALERQHEQLSTHLEERRFKLLAIQEETRQKKKEFTEHVAATEARFREREEELKQIAEANQAQAKRLEDELKRAQALQKKLDDQYQQQFGSQEKKLQVRQAALDKREKELQGERENWRQIYLRNNGDAELKKKQHEVGCLELKRAQAAWERQKKEEQGALNAQRKECDEQLELLARAQSTLVRQDEEAHQSLARIEAETRGLEARARHLQAQLAEVEKSVDEEGVVTGNDWSQPGELRAIALLPGNVESLLTCLEQVTASLEDQRGQLKLQWEKFLQIQSSWCQEHAVLLPEVERIVEELAQREKALNERAEIIHDQNDIMEENRLELQKLARAVEAKRTQVTTQYASLMAEKRAQEKQHQVREGLLKKEKRELTSVREKWKVSREKEVSLLRRELREARATEQMLSETFQHFYRLQTDLTRDKLALAERALALEALKQEILNHAESPAAAERQLKKLERSWKSELSEDRELLEKQQTRLEREHRRLQELFQTAQARADRARELEQELSLKLAEVEEAQLTQKQKDERQRHEIMILREKEAQARTEARKFQSELERLVNLLLNEGEEDQELRVAA